MKLRVLPVALAGTLLASALLIAEPAIAVVSSPGISALDTSVPGKVSGTVTSDQPYVFVGLNGVGGTGYTPLSRITMSGGGAFELETWGFNYVDVEAYACPTDTYVPADCSYPNSKTFTAHDVAPADVTWYADATIGPADPDPVMTVTDAPEGGGVLEAVQLMYGGESGGRTVLTSGVPTELNLASTGRSYAIQIRRCSTDQLLCVPFSPDLTQPLDVVRTLPVDGTVTAPPGTSAVEASFQLHTLVSGQATFTWHLEKASAPGVPVNTEQVTASPLDSSGLTTSVPVSAAGLPDGSYVVAGTITVDSPDFGHYEAVPFTTAPYQVDTRAPALAFAANHPTIYPNINTTKYPGKVSWTITGTGYQQIARAEVRSSGGTLVRNPQISFGVGKAVVQFDGHRFGGAGPVVGAGYYKLLLWDSFGNQVAKYGVVRVDTRHLVTKTWTKKVSAAGSLVDKYVGPCSTLKKNVRGWAYSLGYYANTRCSDDSTKASLVSTVHAVTLPKVYGGYVNVKVTAYGGAAASRPDSRAVIRYLTTGYNWTSSTTVASYLGYHSGLTRAAAGMVFSDHEFAWGFYTGFGHRYDVKNFTVSVKYTTLG